VPSQRRGGVVVQAGRLRQRNADGEDCRNPRWRHVLAVPLLKAVQCLVLPPGTTPAEGASCFVNPPPRSACRTMRSEGHKALRAHGGRLQSRQMLNKLCIKE